MKYAKIVTSQFNNYVYPDTGFIKIINSAEELENILNNGRIYYIVGWNNIIIFGLLFDNIRKASYCYKYTPYLIDQCFDDPDMCNIINQYLNHQCKNKEEAKLKLMAKVLGNNE